MSTDLAHSRKPKAYCAVSDVQLFTSEVPRNAFRLCLTLLTSATISILSCRCAWSASTGAPSLLAVANSVIRTGAPLWPDDSQPPSTHLPADSASLISPFQPKLGRCEHRRLVLTSPASAIARRPGYSIPAQCCHSASCIARSAEASWYNPYQFLKLCRRNAGRAAPPPRQRMPHRSENGSGPQAPQ